MAKQDNEYQDYKGMIVELIDEEGKHINFKLIDVTEYKSEKYALLIPAEENSEVADDEIVIFRFLEKKGTMEAIEDEALLQEVFDFYNGEMDEEEDEDE